VKGRERERERESTLRADIQTALSMNCTVRWIGFLDIVCFSPPSNIWPLDLNVLIWCDRYSPRNISRKICLQVSYGRWQFLPLSTVRSWSIFDMWVILMSSSLWTVEIKIKDSNKSYSSENSILSIFRFVLVLSWSRKI